jgi:hypothetical protein
MPSAWIEQEEARAAAEALQPAVTICSEAAVPYVARSERGAVAIDRLAGAEHVAQIIIRTSN